MRHEIISSAFSLMSKRSTFLLLNSVPNFSDQFDSYLHMFQHTMEVNHTSSAHDSYKLFTADFEPPRGLKASKN